MSPNFMIKWIGKFEWLHCSLALFFLLTNAFRVSFSYVERNEENVWRISINLSTVNFTLHLRPSRCRFVILFYFFCCFYVVPFSYPQPSHLLFVVCSPLLALYFKDACVFQWPDFVSELEKKRAHKRTKQ